jgi:hypothetical protein
MKRTEFKRKLPAPYIKPEREIKPNGVLTRPFSGVIFSALVATLPKEEIVRSEKYLRLVAALPCIACGIEGYSQAAHPRPTAKGRKECDLTTFPLCCVHPGPAGVLVDGCHIDLDRYAVYTRELADAAAILYGIATRKTIRDAGQWPKNVPLFEEQTEIEL